MDNLTHSLIGVTLSRAIVGVPVQGETESAQKKAAFFTLVISNNIPDIDFVLHPFFGNFGNLMHHRGFTHTLFFGVWLALFSAWIAAKLARLPIARATFLKLFGLGCLGVFFHILADSWNDYGVHPLSPFSSNWIYGGFIFIVEPTLWCSMLPLVFFTTARRWVKAGVLVVLAWLLAVASFTSYGSLGLGFAILVWLGIFWTWTSRRRGPLPAVVGVLLVLFVFGFSSLFARHVVRADMAELKPSEIEVDLITGPSPANPICWRSFWVAESGEDQFVVRGGSTSLAPSLISPERCSFWQYGETIMRSSHSSWNREERGSVSDLRRLATQNCGVEQMLHFARAPFWSVDGDSITIGDARYAFRAEGGFAKYTFPLNGYECRYPKVVWKTPFQRHFGF